MNSSIPTLFRIFVLVFLAASVFSAEPGSPPPLVREFRGAWIATVGNINWPSKPGLPSDQQKAELRAILDNAVDLKLNAILFQVRPACDALYKSDIEPWSEYLTGEMGRAPQPFYDPLAYAIEEAHARGLELHAWFNPYRAGILPRKSAVSPKHISKVRPSIVKHYGGYQWLDPGDDAVKEYAQRVILDVVRRYDVDGVHLDDYFYPYKEKDGRGNVIEFPDDNSYKLYRKKGGKLDRADWRRQNVNDLVQRLHSGIHRVKPWVRFGISPFGIWRPGFPAEVRGMDSYETIYGDSRKWLREGWLDYCAPQLYWQVGAPQQSYPSLLKWWLSENPRNRYIFPGSTLSGIGKPTGGWSPSEIVHQINLSRELNDHPGHIIWNFNRILNNQSGIRDALAGQIYTQAALPPAFTWLDPKPPGKPILNLRADSKNTVQWQPTGTKKPWLWALQTRNGDQWTTELIPAQFNARTFSKLPDQISVTSIDRCGNASAPTLLNGPSPVIKRVSANP